MATPYVTEPRKRVPVLREVDVAVVGAGGAGICAAVAAAREGMKTLLLERTGLLAMSIGPGGVSGIFNSFRAPIEDESRAHRQKSFKRLFAGPPWDYVIHVMKLGGMRERTEADLLRCYRIQCDPEILNYGAITFCEKNGVDVLVHAPVVAPILERDRVTGVFIETQSGRRAVLARQVVDCSGDAHVAWMAGAPVVLGRTIGGQTASLLPVLSNYPGEVQDVPFRAGQDGANGPDPEVFRTFAEKHGFCVRRRIDGRGTLRYELSGHGVLISGLDFGDAEDFSLAEIEARKYMHEVFRFWKKYVPGFRKAHLRQVAPQILPRGGRLIVGQYFLDNENLDADLHHPDTIYLHRAVRFKPPKLCAEIPYRVLLPMDVENLLVAGRCASGASSARGTGSCMAMGAAAGVAASVAVRTHRTVRTIDTGRLQERLRAQDILFDKPRIRRVKPKRTLECKYKF